MSFESDYFKRKRLKRSALEPFGFRKQGDHFIYQENFMEDSFCARIIIKETGEVFGQVIDLDMQEEYLAFRVAEPRGNFVGQVLEAYMAILEKIAQTCFEECPFITAQANRLSQQISEQFGERADYPFAKFPEAAIFRNPINNKWYGMIMPVQKGKVVGDTERLSQKDSQTEVEIISFKVRPDDRENLLAARKIYPGYHMNKKSWVSIILDEGVADREIMDFLAYSRSTVTPKSYQALSGPDYWLIPANPKLYDIDQDFAENSVVDWGQKGQIKTGDLVFIYITAPVQALRYACKVLRAPIDSDSGKRMQLQLLAKYADDRYPIAFLKAHDVKAVRGPRRMTKSLIDALKEDLQNDSTNQTN